MKSFQSFLSDVLNSIVTIVMIIVFGSVMIVAVPVLALMFIIILFFGLVCWIIKGELPDIFKKKTLDKD